MARDSASQLWTVIEPQHGWATIDWAELWRYRELIAFLALRDLRVRYKQSLLGAAWAVLQPLLTMAAFTLLFGALLGRDRLPTAEGIPYAISTYCALVPWQLFATSLATSGNSLVQNQALVTKVYFPRLVAPLAPILAALVDFAIAFAVLIAMMGVAGLPIGWQVATLPFFVGLAVAAAFSVAVWLAALNALYRDVRHAIPFLVQVWMFASPVVYTTASVMDGQPDWLRHLYAANPMAGVIEGFRWALLGGASPPLFEIGASLVVVGVVGYAGLHFFRRLERRLVDLI
jgi:homopolymeric O-antigen transport system permease protein